MGRVSTGVGNGEQNENSAIHGMDSLHSNFDSVSLERMSKSRARTYVSGESLKLLVCFMHFNKQKLSIRAKTACPTA